MLKAKRSLSNQQARIGTVRGSMGAWHDWRKLWCQEIATTPQLLHHVACGQPWLNARPWCQPWHMLPKHFQEPESTDHKHLEKDDYRVEFLHWQDQLCNFVR